MTERIDTQVCIVGAGPAGLLLGRMLDLAGVENVILEARDRSYCEQRLRAGVLEQGTTDLLRDLDVHERLDREGLVHGGIELRFAGEGHRIPMDDLTGGRAVTVYGQTEVVKDLIDARCDDGGRLLFEAQVDAVEGFRADDGDVLVRARVGETDARGDAPDGSRAPAQRGPDEGRAVEVACRHVACCDGFHGVGRRAVGDDALTIVEKAYPFSWLGILADVAPSTDELIYAHHADGFAMHSMRSNHVSRLYLQVPPDEDPDAWSDDRVWSELHVRLALDGFTLDEGPITQKGVTPMRSFVAGPLRHGRLFLAGDAAHIVPPTGAKGLNLAAHDVRVLGAALIAAHLRGDASGLDTYSDEALRRVWRAQDFSYSMTTMLHVDPAGDAYDLRRQEARLRYVSTSEAAARSLAENYVGMEEVR